MRGLAALGLRGCNVTTPHKLAIMPLLDRVDDLARRIGAVNTVVVEKDGTLSGFNNDGNGFIQSLRDVDPKWTPASGPIVVLGAGGAARAVVASLAAQGAREIRLINRTFEHAQKIAGELGSPVTAVPWEQRGDALAGIALLANATSAGMTASQRSTSRSTSCPRMRWSATSSTSRRRRRCSRRRAPAAMSR